LKDLNFGVVIDLTVAPGVQDLGGIVGSDHLNLVKQVDEGAMLRFQITANARQPEVCFGQLDDLPLKFLNLNVFDSALVFYSPSFLSRVVEIHFSRFQVKHNRLYLLSKSFYLIGQDLS
jgi:hypothetical protein